MIARVTKRGVTIPKKLLPATDRVDIRREGSVLLVVPVPDADPLLRLGEDPVSCEAPDASEHHDRYL